MTLSSDINKELKKLYKREIIERNCMKGKMGEEFVKSMYELNGYEVERTGKVTILELESVILGLVVL